MDWSIFGVLATLMLTILGATYGQFLSLRNLIFKIKDDIIDKLDYHERHDDTRFQSVRNDIWEIRLRNASLDGVRLRKKETEEENK